MKELSNNKVMVFGDSVSKGVVYDGRELSVLDNGVVKEVTDHYRVEFKTSRFTVRRLNVCTTGGLSTST